MEISSFSKIEPVEGDERVTSRTNVAPDRCVISYNFEQNHSSNYTHNLLIDMFNRPSVKPTKPTKPTKSTCLKDYVKLNKSIPKRKTENSLSPRSVTNSAIKPSYHEGRHQLHKIT